MPLLFLTPDEHAVVAAACERLAPGAAAVGAADYVDGLLGAFEVDPPRIWAGGRFSGRHRGEDGFSRFVPLSPLEERAWRQRIGALQGEYQEGLEALGADFASVPPEEQDARLAAVPSFKQTLFVHCCEGMYADPVYGGNHGGAGWRAIGFPGDSQPRGWTDVEVSGRE